MINRCPGQDDRNIKVEDIACPDCGYRIEFFSDEVKASCPRCKALACRERLPSCVDWCKFTRECIGIDRWKKVRKRVI